MKLFAISALMLGAAFVTPALAQTDANASGNAAAASPAQPAQDANTAAVPAQAAPAQSAQANNGAAQQSAMSGQAGASTSSSGNTQMAMNTTGNATDLSSIPDNQHKYSRAKKASQNRSEGETTKALNQKEASLSGASSTSSAQ